MHEINTILFDLDGTLVESTKELHYEALNQALREISEDFVINREDHNNIYEGLSTRVKLQKLTDIKGLPFALHSAISDRKQEITFEMLDGFDFHPKNRRDLLDFLKSEGYILGLCTNSIRKTTDLILKGLGCEGCFDLILTNEDVRNPKPDPEMYVLAFERLYVRPEHVLILEDSRHGIDAAKKAGGNVWEVVSPEEITTINFAHRL